jgi:hypothetical protein
MRPKALQTVSQFPGETHHRYAVFKSSGFTLPFDHWHFLFSVRPEIDKFGRDQGLLKILPEAYG